MKSATVRAVTGAIVMAAVASAMLLATGGDSGTPSRFELVTEPAFDNESGFETAPERAARPDAGTAPARSAPQPGSGASPAHSVR